MEHLKFYLLITPAIFSDISTIKTLKCNNLALISSSLSYGLHSAIGHVLKALRGS